MAYIILVHIIADSVEFCKSSLDTKAFDSLVKTSSA